MAPWRRNAKWTTFDVTGHAGEYQHQRHRYADVADHGCGVRARPAGSVTMSSRTYNSWRDDSSGGAVRSRFRLGNCVGQSDTLAVSYTGGFQFQLSQRGRHGYSDQGSDHVGHLHLHGYRHGKRCRRQTATTTFTVTVN